MLSLLYMFWVGFVLGGADVGGVEPVKDILFFTGLSCLIVLEGIAKNVKRLADAAEKE